MTTTAKLQSRQSFISQAGLRTTAMAALVLSLVSPNFATAAVFVEPGALGEVFTTKSYDVTTAVRSAGVTNANGSLVVLDFMFGGLKKLRVNGDGLAITATLETDWRTNPSGIGTGYGLQFGIADLVAWIDDGAGFLGDADPDDDTSSSLSSGPHFFDVSGSVATGSFPAYLTDFDGLRFRFNLPQSSNLGFPATVPEEQLVLTSATLTLSSEGRSAGIPGVFAFSEYTVVSVPEPATSVFAALALTSATGIGRRSRRPRRRSAIA